MVEMNASVEGVRTTPAQAPGSRIKRRRAQRSRLERPQGKSK